MISVKHFIKDIQRFNEKVKEKMIDLDIQDLGKDSEGYFKEYKDPLDDEFNKNEYNSKNNLDGNEKAGLKQIKEQIKEDLKKFKMEIVHIKNDQSKVDAIFKDKIDTIMINLDNIKKKLGIATEEEENIFDKKINDLRVFVLQKMGEYDQIGEEESMKNVDEKSLQEKQENMDTISDKGDEVKRQPAIDQNSQSNSEMGKRIVKLEKEFKSLKNQVADIVKNKVNQTEFNSLRDNVSNIIINF